ncbi:MAG: cytochrome c3 family protein, partial [Gemmatimonadota bacterium]|nr:cytochrome c3 family protein [Gemmatimonadota bacterium]
MRWSWVGWILVGGVALLMARPAAGQDAESCQMCHSEPSFFKNNPDSARLVVSEATLSGSVHGPAGLRCGMCHPGMATFPHPADAVPMECGACHAGVRDQYVESLHGYAVARGNPRAPTCVSCHGSHDVRSSRDPASPTHKVRLPSTCAACHGEAGLLTDQIVKLPQSFTDYAQSIHGMGTGRGIAAAASCADCHSVHDLLGAADPNSRINPRNVARTCGQCHPDIQLQYDQSIHGRALQAGVGDSPTCTDCHGEHHILSPRNPEAKTYGARLAHETCGRCHEDPMINAKYNMAGGVVESYSDSYHGWATRHDYARAATCVACHTAHLVLPKSDSASTVAIGNVVQTCQQCHPNADLTFAASYTHETASIARNPINRWIKRIYLIVIIGFIGGMVLHNLVIMNYYMMKRRREIETSQWVLRFDRSQVLQHLLLTLTFVALVITGFALRFPDAWWVGGLRQVGMTEPVRLNVHRFAAVGLIVASLWHAYYVLLTRRGKLEFRALWVSWRDLREFVGTLRYHTFRSDKKVKFGRYDYSQKAEYWALIWGTGIMAVTGLILWFPAATTRFLPAVTVSAAQTVHYYEAWL